MKIYNENLSCNLDTAIKHINELGWAEYLVQILCIKNKKGGKYIVAILKMPDGMKP